MNMEEYIASRLSELRELKGYSAREMSLELGLDATYIGKIENGKNSPSVKQLQAIFDFLDVTLFEFFGPQIGRPKNLDKIEKICCRNDQSVTDALYLSAVQMDKHPDPDDAE